MRWRNFVYILTSTLPLGCSRDANILSSLGLRSPVTISAIEPLPRDPLGVVVRHDASSGYLVRVRYISDDRTENAITPWQSADSSIVVLGLKPGQTYLMGVESLVDGSAVSSSTKSYTTPPLPSALAQIQMNIQGTMSGGYSVTSIGGSDGDDYLIIFDSLGTIRWFRDFGTQALFAIEQQQDGHITAFVGGSNGFNASVGLYVEVTPTGDSVRSITAVGSPYTDPHELLEGFDPRGNRRADYLFGYGFETVDRTAIGGGPSDIIAVHQVLRINTAGKVDTLISGAEHWNADDDVAPPLIGDLDHPNSIDFDLDGGVIVSYRNLSAIVKVNRRTHEFVWQFGGTHNQFTLVGDPLGGFAGQHTARILPNGHLLIFDNGWNHSPQQSRAVEYDLDTVAKTATMVWQYSANPPIFNDFTGSAQRLENGNTVVAFTRKGIVDEARPDGTLLSRATLESSPGVIATPYRVTRIKSLYGYARP
jgi:Arylsulfotransferase (ASST)